MMRSASAPELGTGFASGLDNDGEAGCARRGGGCNGGLRSGSAGAASSRHASTRRIFDKIPSAAPGSDGEEHHATPILVPRQTPPARPADRIRPKSAVLRIEPFARQRSAGSLPPSGPMCHCQRSAPNPGRAPARRAPPPVPKLRQHSLPPLSAAPGPSSVSPPRETFPAATSAAATTGAIQYRSFANG